jgi:hypothetical protein
MVNNPPGMSQQPQTATQRIADLTLKHSTGTNMPVSSVAPKTLLHVPIPLKTSQFGRLYMLNPSPSNTPLSHRILEMVIMERSLLVTLMMTILD